LYAVVYRWRIRPELEDTFERAWHLGTLAIRRDLGGEGSCLHRSGPGEYFAYAYWRTRVEYERNRAARMPYEDPIARELYTKALEGGELEVVLTGDVVDDLLLRV